MHLTDRQIAAYRQHSLPVTEWASVSDHLAQCADCRGKVASPSPQPPLSLRMLIHAESVHSHLTAEELIALCDSTATDDARHFAENHLETCDRCRAEYAELRQFAAELGRLPETTHEAAVPAPGHVVADPWERFAAFARTILEGMRGTSGKWAAAAAAILICVGVWAVSHDRPSPRIASGMREATPTPAQEQPSPAIVSNETPPRSSTEWVSRTAHVSGFYMKDGARELIFESDRRLQEGQLPMDKAQLLERLLTPSPIRATPPPLPGADFILDGSRPPSSPPPSSGIQAPGRPSFAPPANPTPDDLAALRAASNDSRLAYALGCIERGFYQEARAELQILREANSKFTNASEVITRLIEALPRETKSQP